jgi:hypothetical protein
VAVEVPAGPAADSRRPSAIDHGDGVRESDLGEERIADELLLKLGLAVSPVSTGYHFPEQCRVVATPILSRP